LINQFRVQEDFTIKKSAAMTNIVTAVQARTQFGQILRRVNKNKERFVVDRRGEPQAVIMSMQDYVDLVAPEPEWLRKIGEASQRRGTDKLTMRQIDTVIARVRREQAAKQPR
jgi:prevent-host-death family protein